MSAADAPCSLEATPRWGDGADFRSPANDSPQEDPRWSERVDIRSPGSDLTNPEIGAPSFCSPQDYSPQDSQFPHQPKVAYAAQIAQFGLQGFLQHAYEQGAGFSTLSLAENVIGDRGAEVLSSVMSGSPFLCRLNLHDTGLGSDGFDAIGGLLHTCPQLETLVLSGNRLGGACLPEVFCRAVEAAPALRALQLSACELTDASVQPLFQALCKRTLLGLEPLERLTLAENRLEGARAADLCGVLAASGALRGLDLGANGLGPAGGEALAQRLQGATHCALKRLCVKANALELRGCRALVRLWSSPSGLSLEHLDLRENRLTEANCKELCRMLGKELSTELRFGSGRRISMTWHNRLGVMNRKPHGGRDPLNVFWHDND